jgi:tRNA nucleotidyltransferase (CCA-adding enzyme)
VPDFAVYALLLSSKGKAKRAMENYLTRWQYVKPRATGHDLKQLGLAPGPEYKSILRQLRNAWLDGEVNSEKGENNLLEQLINKSR